MWTLVPFVLFFLQSAVGDDSFALDYLNKYHYISPTRSGNHDVATAVRRFQEFFHLPVTGKIDDATRRQMEKPRCGLPDPVESTRHKRYATASKWGKTYLKYFIQYGQDLPQSTQDHVFRTALNMWAAVTPLKFSQTQNPREADIKISFGTGSHGGVSGEQQCPYAFDGRGGVLAHAYFPSDGRAHFDDHEAFTHETNQGTNLLYVAVHEFGHSLGLQHSNVRGAIMWPSYEGYRPNLALHQDDIAGVHSLYGGPGSGGGGGSATCEDEDANCPYWDIYCNNNDYVIQNCKKTCGRC